MAATSHRKLVWVGFLIPPAWIALLITTSLGDAWAAWWSGDSTMDMRLGWWPMLIWSRIGKVLQLLAGLAVILDLIDLDRLRRFAVKLDRRGRDLSHLAPIERYRATVYGVREELADCLVHTKTLGARGGATLDISSLRVKPHLSVSEETEDMLDTVDVPELLSRMHAEAAKEGWRGAELTRSVRGRIDMFLAGHLGPGERGWSGKVAYQFQASSSIFGLFGVLAAVAVTAAVTLALASTALSNWISASIALAVFVVSVTIGILPLEDWRLGGSLLAAWRSGCARILCLFADVIGTARPGHVFRWVALWFFLAGMHFDLLAS
ncbi:hypothetical protein ACLQ3B_24795 [Micromonospora sp. DT53]|uniref:hypothetical protein n=1 Tax=Micromonospora sp. DT53 TaxID=3393444 RepID=UPI003CFAD4AA